MFLRGEDGIITWLYMYVAIPAAPAFWQHFISCTPSPTKATSAGSRPHCLQMWNTAAGSGLHGSKSRVNICRAQVRVHDEGQDLEKDKSNPKAVVFQRKIAALGGIQIHGLQCSMLSVLG